MRVLDVFLAGAVLVGVVVVASPVSDEVLLTVGGWDRRAGWVRPAGSLAWTAGVTVTVMVLGVDAGSCCGAGAPAPVVWGASMPRVTTTASAMMNIPAVAGVRSRRGGVGPAGSRRSRRWACSAGASSSRRPMWSLARCSARLALLARINRASQLPTMAAAARLKIVVGRRSLWAIPFAMVRRHAVVDAAAIPETIFRRAVLLTHHIQKCGGWVPPKPFFGSWLQHVTVTSW